jgi:hypothetical protein
MEKTMGKATPNWRAMSDDEGNGIYDENGKWIAHVTDQDHTDKIVKAVNLLPEFITFFEGYVKYKQLLNNGELRTFDAAELEMRSIISAKDLLQKAKASK